jgi:hypothetical protein
MLFNPRLGWEISCQGACPSEARLSFVSGFIAVADDIVIVVMFAIVESRNDPMIRPFKIATFATLLQERT